MAGRAPTTSARPRKGSSCSSARLARRNCYECASSLRASNSNGLASLLSPVTRSRHFRAARPGLPAGRSGRPPAAAAALSWRTTTTVSVAPSPSPSPSPSEGRGLGLGLEGYFARQRAKWLPTRASGNQLGTLLSLAPAGQLERSLLLSPGQLADCRPEVARCEC